MEQQIQRLVDLTEKGLTELAIQLGVSLPQLWGILIKQQYVEAAQAFFGFGICLFLVSFVYKKKEAIEKFRKGDSDSYDNFDRTMLLLLLFLGLLTITIITFIGAMDGIGKIINPDYYAIQDLVNFIGNMSSNNLIN